MLNKAIEHNKEYRKPYYGSRAMVKSARNHGGDPYSYTNYVISSLRRLDAANAQLNDYYHG